MTLQQTSPRFTNDEKFSLAGQIGNTPLVKLGRIVPNQVKSSVYAKLEFANPGGSVKDRCALAMIEDAESSGRLKPGTSTIVEASSGNTGIGLALICASRGYKLIITIPEKMSIEKKSLLKAYGAEVIITPNLPHSDPGSYIEVAKRITNEVPDAVFLDQTNNQANAKSHLKTGQEIYEQMAGKKITALVAGAGTGGTISGVGTQLKRLSRETRIIGVDPEGSVLSGGTDAAYKVEGIGYDFIPTTLWPGVVDEWIRVPDKVAFQSARDLAKLEGLLCGGSSGAAIHAALEIASRYDSRDDNIVVILPDTGERYLSTVYNDEWMIKNGFMDEHESRSTDERLLSIARKV